MLRLTRDLERIQEEKSLNEKRATLEEEALRKRILVHEENTLKQEDNLRQMEASFIKDIEDIKRRNDI